MRVVPRGRRARKSRRSRAGRAVAPAGAGPWALPAKEVVSAALRSSSAPKEEGAVDGAPSSQGHRLLSQLGWEPGTGLGKKRQGRLAPVVLPRKTNRLGLGMETYLSERKRHMRFDSDDEAEASLSAECAAVALLVEGVGAADSVEGPPVRTMSGDGSSRSQAQHDTRCWM